MDRSSIGRRSLIAGAGLLAARPVWAQPAPDKPRVVMRTRYGAIVVELEAKRAPITSENFLHYVDTMKFDGGHFYRASRDPNIPGGGTIQGSPALKTALYPRIRHESTLKTGLTHTTGTISMARDAPGTANADFFICASPEPYLDANPAAKGDNQGFAAFGGVVDGMDVVRTILALPTNGKTGIPEFKGQILSPPVTIIDMRRMG
jgi:peptidyl-prolyl cis-trans isomerase A (cyclophilin A)